MKPGMKEMTVDDADLKWVIRALIEQTGRFADLQDAGQPAPRPSEIVFYCDITKRTLYVRSVEESKRSWPGLFFPLDDESNVWVVLVTPSGSHVTTTFHILDATGIEMKGSA